MKRENFKVLLSMGYSRPVVFFFEQHIHKNNKKTNTQAHACAWYLRRSIVDEEILTGWNGNLLTPTWHLMIKLTPFSQLRFSALTVNNTTCIHKHTISHTRERERRTPSVEGT